MATLFLIKWWDNLRQMVLDTIPAWWESPFSRCTAYWPLQVRTEKWAPEKERVSAQEEPWAVSFVIEDLLEKQFSTTKDLIIPFFFWCVISSIPHQTPGCWSQPLICSFFLIITTKPLFIPWLVSSWIFSLIQQSWSSTNRWIKQNGKGIGVA